MDQVAAHPELQKKQSMADYTIRRTLGEGSYGRAMQCVQKETGFTVVVKEMRAFNTTRQIKEGLKEIEVQKLLSTHPFIVPYKSAFVENGCLYIVMAFCSKGDLYRQICEYDRQRKYFSARQVMKWFVQICLALKHMHDRKVLHRDLKSQNVFINAVGDCQLGDFGISAVLKKTLEKAKTACGTPLYMSPEICSGEPYGAATDMWSLGCLLYEMCAQRMPFRAHSLRQLVACIQECRYDPLPSFYPQEIMDIVKQLLVTDPKARPRAHELLLQPFVKRYVDDLSLPRELLEAEFSHTVIHDEPAAPGSPDGAEDTPIDPVGVLDAPQAEDPASRPAPDLSAVIAVEPSDVSHLVPALIRAAPPVAAAAAPSAAAPPTEAAGAAAAAKDPGSIFPPRRRLSDPAKRLPSAEERAAVLNRQQIADAAAAPPESARRKQPRPPLPSAVLPPPSQAPAHKPSISFAQGSQVVRGRTPSAVPAATPPGKRRGLVAELFTPPNGRSPASDGSSPAVQSSPAAGTPTQAAQGTPVAAAAVAERKDHRRDFPAPAASEASPSQPAEPAAKAGENKAVPARAPTPTRRTPNRSPTPPASKERRTPTPTKGVRTPNRSPTPAAEGAAPYAQPVVHAAPAEAPRVVLRAPSGNTPAVVAAPVSAQPVQKFTPIVHHAPRAVPADIPPPRVGSVTPQTSTKDLVDLQNFFKECLGAVVFQRAYAAVTLEAKATTAEEKTAAATEVARALRGVMHFAQPLRILYKAEVAAAIAS